MTDTDKETKSDPVALRVALQSLVAAINRYATPHDLVQAVLRNQLDGDAWSNSWNAIRSAKAEAERVLESDSQAAEAAGWVMVPRGVLAWTGEVYPATNQESGGAIVHMTWEQFNAMRVAIGLKTVKPPKAASLTEKDKT